MVEPTPVIGARMSEPTSSVEIEDVLSSIRRLVSEDLRPARPVEPAAGPAKTRRALILTPALRVVPEAETAAKTSAAPVASLPIEQWVASVRGTVPSGDQQWEPEAGDAEPAAEPVWADETWEDAQAVGDAEACDPPRQSEPEAVSQSAEANPEDIGDGFAGTFDAGPDSGPVAAEHPEWLAAAEAEVIAGLEQAPERSNSDLPGTDLELSFDEEVLRDLVRDLLREELQGDLGERITRNIRKLVRAEIARAGATAELE